MLTRPTFQLGLLILSCYGRAIDFRPCTYPSFVKIKLVVPLDEISRHSGIRSSLLQGDCQPLSKFARYALVYAEHRLAMLEGEQSSAVDARTARNLGGARSLASWRSRWRWLGYMCCPLREMQSRIRGRGLRVRKEGREDASKMYIGRSKRGIKGERPRDMHR